MLTTKITGLSPMEELEALVDKALKLDKWSIGQLISVFENNRLDAPDRRKQVLDLITQKRGDKRAVFLGITGTPGAGKSTLIGELAAMISRENPDKSVAVLAVDPASQVSGGSLLGDRTRVRFPTKEKRLFFRSQSSDRELGGVSRHTFQVCRLLSYLFDYVFIETVGIGQSEIEIQFVADRIYLVMQPMAGDQIQFMKAGIMEIPDVFILNKSDEEEAANKSFYALRASLSFARPGEENSLEIFRTSAKTGLGLPKLIEEMTGINNEQFRHTIRSKETYFFNKWVRDEYGRQGLHKLLNEGEGAQELEQAGARFINNCGGFDQAQAEFTKKHS